MTEQASRLTAAGLAACMLGFVLCPFPFLVIALRGDLQYGVRAALVVSSFVLGAAVLLIRFLRRPPQGARDQRAWLIELPCWAAVTYSLLVLSAVNLARGLERWGSASLFFLCLSSVFLPIVLLRSTEIEHRLTRWPHKLRLGALLTVLSLTILVAWQYLATPTQFI